MGMIFGTHGDAPKAEYRLVVSPSLFRETYVDARTFRWYVSALYAAFMITMNNSHAYVQIQKRDVFT